MNYVMIYLLGPMIGRLGQTLGFQLFQSSGAELLSAEEIEKYKILAKTQPYKHYITILFVIYFFLAITVGLFGSMFSLSFIQGWIFNSKDALYFATQGNNLAIFGLINFVGSILILDVVLGILHSMPPFSRYKNYLIAYLIKK